jgi:hypothetical protein
MQVSGALRVRVNTHVRAATADLVDTLERCQENTLATTQAIMLSRITVSSPVILSLEWWLIRGWHSGLNDILIVTRGKRF